MCVDADALLSQFQLVAVKRLRGLLAPLLPAHPRAHLLATPPMCRPQGVGRALQQLLPREVPLNLRLPDNYVKVAVGLQH